MAAAAAAATEIERLGNLFGVKLSKCGRFAILLVILPAPLNYLFF